MIQEAGSNIPMWLNVAIGIATALGGWEAIKYLLSLRHHRKKDKAEAQKEEALAQQEGAHAKQEDTDWREKELALMTQFVNTAKVQYEDLTHRYDDLTARYDDLAKERKECHTDKAQMQSAMRRFAKQVEEQERKMEGLQKAFTEEVARRQAVERFYCSIEECKKRRPPLGTYSAEAADTAAPVKAKKTVSAKPKAASPKRMAPPKLTMSTI